MVVAADAWTAPLIEPLGTSLPLIVTREQVTYYDTDAPQLFELGTSRCGSGWTTRRSTGSRRSAQPGVKIAQDCGGSPVDPDTRGFEPDPAILARTDAFAAEAFAGRLGPALSTTTCLYTLPPDRDFVVDALPGHPNIHVALGAGHGYKFVAWFGKTLAARRVVACRLRPQPVPPRPAGPDRPVVGSELAGVITPVISGDAEAEAASGESSTMTMINRMVSMITLPGRVRRNPTGSSWPTTNDGCRGSGPPSAHTNRVRNDRLAMPRCTRSQIAQSCRLTMCQKSTASEASKTSLGNLVGMEQHLALDRRTIGRDRLEDERGDVVA